MKKSTKKIIIAAVAAAALAGAAAGVFACTMPYEVTADGQTLVVVKNKAAGKEVVRDILESYVPEDTELKTVSLDKNLQVQAVGMKKYFSAKDQIKSRKDAEAYLIDANGREESLFAATITSQYVKEETYTPEIDYRADDKALAGTKRVEKEGKDGRRKATYQVTTVNGVETASEIVDEEILKKGESAIIYKGTLGVPEGKDWKTYEGNPVFNDGNDVASTALQYLGCPYKYGGKSFATGIDCVQYVVQIYRMYGVTIPKSHSKLRKVGKGVSRSAAQPGDIICYNHHVAIYLGNGKMAEATRKKGTKVSKVRGGIITIRHVNKND